MGFLKILENAAVKTWNKDGITFFIVLRKIHPLPHFHCGYATFPDKTMLDNAESKVDVHGGITLNEMDGTTAIYGFDCAHAWDENNALIKTEEWLTDECEKMGAQIAALYESGESF